MSGLLSVTVGMGDIDVLNTSVAQIYNVSDGGVLIIPSGLTTAAVGTTINLLGSGTLEVGTSLVTLGLLSGLHLSGTGNELQFSNPALLNGLNLSGTGFGTTDSIALTGTDSITSQSYDPATGQLAIATTAGFEIVTLPEHLAGGFTLTQAGGESVITYTACFARGTLIDTPSGGTAVEDLAPGAEVSLAGGGTAPVRWIGHRRMRPALAADPASLAPVVVAAGALGDGMPRRTLRLSPDHALLLDGALVPARLLVNGQTIRSEIVDRIDYFHVELDRHDAILAEGAPAETYLDTGNRSMFANAAISAVHPTLTGSLDADPSLLCAPMVLGGERLEAIRARLGLLADGASVIARQAGVA